MTGGASRPLLPGILLLGALQFLLFLDRQDITASFEGRVAAPAREMVTGGDWLVPHLNGELRLQKPPVPYWAAAALWKLTGTFAPGLARLPPALCGLLALLVLMDLGRRLLGPAGGIASGLVWTATFFTVDEFRKAMADPYLAGFSLLAVWAWVAADRALRDSGARRAPGLAVLFWCALALGGLAKGPVVLVHLLVAVLPYHLAERSRPRWTWGHAVGLAAFAAIALPWPLLVLERVPGALSLWREQSLGQITTARNVRPFWYYLPQIPYVALPWTLFALPALAGWWRGRRGPGPRLLWPLLWFAAGVAFFSLSNMKKNAYLLPLAPPLVLVLAAGVARFLAPGPGSGTRGRRLFLDLHAVGGALAIGGVTAYHAAALLESRGALFPELAVLGVLAAAVLAPALAVTCGRAAGDRGRLVAVAALFALLVHLKVAWLEPVRENASSLAPFARRVNEVVRDEPVWALGGVPEALVFYLGRKVMRLDRLPAEPSALAGFLLLRAGKLPAEFAGREVLAAEDRGRRGRASYHLVRLGPP